MESKLEKEISQIEKDYGKGSIITKSSVQKVDTISTGSLKLDIATGIGGLPRGRIVEIIGWESSGKSTITQNVIANAQKKGIKCLLVDGEYSFDGTYARRLGVDIDDLLIVQLDEKGAEKCYNMAERLIKTGEVGVVVIDSQTSLLPKKVIEGEIGQKAIGHNSQLMSTIVPKILTAAGMNNCLVIFISQFREKIGVMFGSPETTSGGNALKFYSHMRIEVRKSIEKEDGIAFANETRCKIIKNKLAPPFKDAKFRIVFGEGIDRIQENLDLAIEYEIIKKAGSWYSYGEIRLQGEDNVREILEGTPELLEEIEQKVKQIAYEKNSSQQRQQQPQEEKVGQEVTNSTIPGSEEETN